MENNLKVAHKSTGEIKTKEEQKLYDVLKKLPSPKKRFNLSKDQIYWWYWFGKEFLSTNQLCQLDLIHLQDAAIWLDARNKNLQKINKLNEQDPDGVRGWVQTFKNETNNITGYVTMLKKASEQLDKVSAHFGLSVKDRQKLKPVESTGQLSLFENVLTALQKAN